MGACGSLRARDAKNKWKVTKYEINMLTKGDWWLTISAKFNQTTYVRWSTAQK